MLMNSIVMDVAAANGFSAHADPWPCSCSGQRSQSSPLHLQDYHISPVKGFLPDRPPLTRLPGEYFAPWEDLMARLPELNKTQQLRAEVDRLPERDFNESTLKSEEEWRRAYVVLCFIGQSYIWGEGQKNLVNKVPRKVAVPWCHVSEHLHLNPVGCYASTVLYNFHLIDPEGPWSAGNLKATSSFTGSSDEDGFYTSFVLVELAAVPAIRAIGRVFDDMANRRDASVKVCLKDIKDSLRVIRGELKQMADRCSPTAFYTDIRPFQAGSKGLDAFPEGLIYEGVDLKPKQYRGANAGQSSIIYAIDVSLGTKHHGKEDEFLTEMKTYMPHKHQEFLGKLADMTPVRDYCKASGNADLIASFNETVEELAQFRTDHVILVTRFIVNQRQHSINPALNTKGSGGTDFMQLLKKIRNETLKMMV